MFNKTLLPIALFVVLEVFLNYTGLDDLSDCAEYLYSVKLHNSIEKVELLTLTLNFRF